MTQSDGCSSGRRIIRRGVEPGCRTSTTTRLTQNVWSPLSDSNQRPSPYHGDALPTELRGRAYDGVQAVRYVKRPSLTATAAPPEPLDRGLPALSSPFHTTALAPESEPSSCLESPIFACVWCCHRQRARALARWRVHNAACRRPCFAPEHPQNVLHGTSSESNAEFDLAPQAAAT